MRKTYEQEQKILAALETGPKTTPELQEAAGRHFTNAVAALRRRGIWVTAEHIQKSVYSYSLPRSYEDAA